jgi:hypothetical protein
MKPFPAIQADRGKRGQFTFVDIKHNLIGDQAERGILGLVACGGTSPEESGAPVIRREVA